MGADKIFGSKAEFGERMIVTIDDFANYDNEEEKLSDHEGILPLKHKNHHPIEELPASLRKAVIHFILIKPLER